MSKLISLILAFLCCLMPLLAIIITPYLPDYGWVNLSSSPESIRINVPLFVTTVMLIMTFFSYSCVTWKCQACESRARETRE